MSMIHIQNLTFAYDGSYENVFENISLRLDTDWKLGFTGRNGRGKTTFLNLLLGKYPYSGTISASVNFEYFPYEVRDKSNRTSEAIAEIADFQEWELLRELNLLDVNEDVLDRPFSTLSNGEQTKVLLAALFLRENSFLLIDEPTNHLDSAARMTVSSYLNSKSGFILVSHDRAFLDNCIDHVLSINKTDIEIQKGDFSSWLYNKELQDNFELAESEKLKKDIKRLKAAAAQTADWSDRAEKTKRGTRNSGLRPDTGYIGHKASKMMKRSKAIDERRQAAVEEKSKLLKNVETAEALKIHPLAYHSSTLVSLKDVSVRYGDRAVCDPVSFTIQSGDRIALSGKNGCGKSSILKLICGEDIPHTGEVKVGSGVKISYIKQDSSGMSGSLEDYAAGLGIDESLFKAILRKLDFTREQFEHDISEFSAGQKKKVLLAGSLSEEAHIYIWDEPLNYIDVISRMQIEELLAEYRPTLLFVEHDNTFCENIASKIIFM